MSSDERIRNRRSFRSPMFYIGLAMTVFYIILGIWLLLDASFLPGVPRDFRNVFTAMVLVYGVFRGWRVWADYGRQHD